MRPSPLRPVRLALAVAVVATGGLLGCGGNSSDIDTGLASGSSIISTRALDRSRVTQQEIARAGRGTARAAFLQYWSSLQSQAWADALDAFDPSLVRSVGAARLLQGFKSQSTSFSLMRPRVESIRSRGDDATVAYEVESGRTPVQLRSVRFNRSSGSWRIVYDAFIDSALRQAAQTATQADINSNATTPSQIAVSAGVAAERRQSDWYESRVSRGSRGSSTQPTPAP